MPKTYLTIDDSPSAHFRELVDFLSARKIQAVFFCRGDLLDADKDSGVYALQKGHILANHGYHHKRASLLSFQKVCAEIADTDAVLEDVYARSGHVRPGKYFRFPYMDRGMGAYFCEPGSLKPEYETAQNVLLRSGLGHTPAMPEASKIAHKRKIQDFLLKSGYAPLPTPGVTLPWYAQTEMAQAIDSLCTFSTSDWAITARHKGKHGYSTLADLKAKIDTDLWLKDTESAHIVLAHDQDEIYPVVTALVDHFLESGFEFLDFPLDSR